MTLEEAQKIAFIIGHADGGCASCVEDLVNLSNEILPEFIFSTGHSIPPQYDENYDIISRERIDVIVGWKKP